MREEKFQKIQLVMQSLTALGTFGIAVSICISVYSFKEAQEMNRLTYEATRHAHEWNRRSYTVDIIRGFEGHVVGYRKTLQEALPGVFRLDQRGVIEPGTAESLWLGNVEPNSKYPFMKDKKRVEELKNHLIGVLNYMEYLAQTYNEHVVDQEAFEESLAEPMILYHDVLYEFIKASQKHLRYNNWQPFLDVVAHLKEKRREGVARPKAATGR